MRWRHIGLGDKREKSQLQCVGLDPLRCNRGATAVCVTETLKHLNVCMDGLHSELRSTHVLSPEEKSELFVQLFRSSAIVGSKVNLFHSRELKPLPSASAVLSDASQ